MGAGADEPQIDATRPSNRPPTGPTPSRPRRSGHTPVQRVLLATSGLTALACFAGAGGILYAKHQREQFQVVSIDVADPAGPTAPAPNRTAAPATTAPVAATAVSAATAQSVPTAGTSGPAATGPGATEPTVAPSGGTQPDVTEPASVTTSRTTPAGSGTGTTGATAVGATTPGTGTTASTGSARPSTRPTASTAAPTTVTADTFPVIDPTPINFLVAGADANACLDPGSKWNPGAASDRAASSRSDTIMIIRLDPSTDRAAVLSFPRDLWIKKPGGGHSRINATFRPSNPKMLVATIEQNFNVKVDRYLEVDFCAFKTMVEAVGGVTVPFKYPIRDTSYTDISIPAGCHTFGGDEALAYVRARHLSQKVNGKWRSDQTSDFGRIARQQDFLTRMLRKALDKGLFNPSVARGVLETLIKGYIKTNERMSIDDFMQFAGAARKINPATIARYQIEGRAMWAGSEQVIRPSSSKEMTAILKIFRGEARLEPAQASTTAAPTTAAAATPGTTTAPATGTTTEPDSNVGGDILPDPNVTC